MTRPILSRRPANCSHQSFGALLSLAGSRGPQRPATSLFVRALTSPTGDANLGGAESRGPVACMAHGQVA